MPRSPSLYLALVFSIVVCCGSDMPNHVSSRCIAILGSEGGEGAAGGVGVVSTGHFGLNGSSIPQARV
jgi:hypothetical protein